MGLLDAQNQYSDFQAVAATGPSTNVIDHGTQRDLGIGEPMTVEVTVDVALSGTNAQVTLQTDSAVGFGTAVNVVNSAVYTVLAAAARIYLNLPPINTSTAAGSVGIKRYTRLNYTLTAATITVTAELIPLRMAQAENVFPTGFLVD